MLTAIRELTIASSSTARSCMVSCRTGFMPLWPRSMGLTCKPKSTSTSTRVQFVSSSSRPLSKKSLIQPRSLTRRGAFRGSGISARRSHGDPVDFTEFGRAAVQAAKQRISNAFAKVNARVSRRVSSKVGELLSGEGSRSSAAARRNAQQVPRSGSNHAVPRAEPSRALSSRGSDSRSAQARRGDSKGPRLILSRGDPAFVQALFKLEVPEYSNHRRNPCSGARSRQPIEDRRLVAR